MSKYCPRCGLPVPVNAKYCRNCGQKLRSKSEIMDDAEEKPNGTPKQDSSDRSDTQTDEILDGNKLVDGKEKESNNTDKNQYDQHDNDDHEVFDNDTELDDRTIISDYRIIIFVAVLAVGIFCILYNMHRLFGNSSTDVSQMNPDPMTAPAEEINGQSEEKVPEDNIQSVQEEIIVNTPSAEDVESKKEEKHEVTVEEILTEFQQHNWESYASMVCEYMDVFDTDKISYLAQRSSEVAEVEMLVTRNWESMTNEPSDDEKFTHYRIELKDSLGNEIELGITKRFESEKSSVMVSVTDKWGVLEYNIYDERILTQQEPLISDGRLVGIRTYSYSYGIKELIHEDIYEYLDYPSDGLYEDVEYAGPQNSSVKETYKLFDSNGRILYCSDEFIDGRYTYFQYSKRGEVYYYYDDQGNMVREKTYEILDGRKAVRFNEYAYENDKCVSEYNYDENWALQDSIGREFNEHGDLTKAVIVVNDYTEINETALEFSYSYDEYGRISYKRCTNYLDFVTDEETFYTYY